MNLLAPCNTGPDPNRKPQPHLQIASQNPILRDQVLVAEQQILTHAVTNARRRTLVESIAHGGTSIITTVGQRSSFAPVFWMNGRNVSPSWLSKGDDIF
jgi:hypothetical protein